VEEGNIGKWFYEEDGRWQWSNHSWTGGYLFGFGGCVKCPTYQLPEYRKMYDGWVQRNFAKMTEIGGAGGGAEFVAFGVNPTYIDVAGGAGVLSDVKYRDVQYELWKDFLITQIKTLGGIHYWMGEIIGRSLVDSGALTEEYYNFMITIKKALDPNKILSPGKFYLGDKY